MVEAGVGARQGVRVRAYPADDERRLQLAEASEGHTIAASCKNQEPAGCEQVILWGKRICSLAKDQQATVYVRTAAAAGIMGSLQAERASVFR